MNKYQIAVTEITHDDKSRDTVFFYATKYGFLIERKHFVPHYGKTDPTRCWDYETKSQASIRYYREIGKACQNNSKIVQI